MTKKHDRNKNGLSRYIPSEIKSIIRERSYFGCVVCGNLFCDYEHVDPLFCEAKEHDPEKMCLLCPNHHRYLANACSKERIKEAMLDPYGKDRHVNRPIENFLDNLSFKIGGLTFKNMHVLV